MFLNQTDNIVTVWMEREQIMLQVFELMSIQHVNVKGCIIEDSKLSFHWTHRNHFELQLLVPALLSSVTYEDS